MSITAKSVIFDVADNWGATDYLGLRRIVFSLAGVDYSLVQADYIADATSDRNTGTLPEYAFDTSLSVTGGAAGNSWQSILHAVTNQRFIIVFNSAIEFDEIACVNFHTTGGDSTRSLKNVKITTSTDTITDTTYNAAVANSTVLNNTEWAKHSATNEADWQIVWKSNAVKSVIFDIADNWGNGSYGGLRGIEFYFGGTNLSLLSSDYTATATAQVSGYDINVVFDTSKVVTGDSNGTDRAWYTNPANIRVIIVFSTAQEFDEIQVSNSHHSGAYTNRGVKNVKITTSTDTITDTTYNAAVANSTVLNNTEWAEHSAVDEADWQIVWLNSFEKTDRLIPAFTNFAKPYNINFMPNFKQGDVIRNNRRGFSKAF